MKLQIEILRQDYVDFNKYHFIQTKLKKTIIIGIVTVVILQLVLNYEHFDLYATILSTAGCIIYYVWAIYYRLRNTKKIPEENGSILGWKEIEFTNENISYKTQDSQGTNHWSSIHNFKESSKAFYLYTDTNMAIVVPKRYFNANAMDEFRNLVNKNMV